MSSCFDITNFKRCQVALQAKHDDLERLVQDRTNALSVTNVRLQEEIATQKLAELKLKKQQAQLHALASEVSLVQERERRRIALGLHDDIGQVLALAKLKIGVLLESQSQGRDLESLENIRYLLDQALQATRSATFELSCPILHELGLEAALQRLIVDFEKRNNICFLYKTDHQEAKLIERTRIIMYRVIRELFFNIIKHAKARHATLSIRKAGQYLNISVKDDGVGSDTTIDQGFDPSGGFGLFSISEQLQGIGGNLRIVSSPGAGTQVRIAVPWGDSAACTSFRADSRINYQLFTS